MPTWRCFSPSRFESTGSKAKNEPSTSIFSELTSTTGARIFFLYSLLCIDAVIYTPSIPLSRLSCKWSEGKKKREKDACQEWLTEWMNDHEGSKWRIFSHVSDMFDIWSRLVTFVFWPIDISLLFFPQFNAMMRTTRTDHLLFPTASLDSSAAKTDRKDVDSVSYSSLNFEDHSGLHYLANHQTNTYPNHRRTANRHANTTVSTHQESYDHGLMINTSFFDGHLFQPSRSSYILDYNDTPKDLNQFLAGHRMSAESSQLDPHLFKLSFILTLSDWHKDKEVLLDYCPREENDESLLREINAYKQLCFPELNSKQKNGGNLINDSSTYVFTRTLSNGQVEYGYCRRMLNDSNQKSQYPIVICIGNDQSICPRANNHSLF